MPKKRMAALILLGRIPLLSCGPKQACVVFGDLLHWEITPLWSKVKLPFFGTQQGRVPSGILWSVASEVYKLGKLLEPWENVSFGEIRRISPSSPRTSLTGYCAKVASNFCSANKSVCRATGEGNGWFPAGNNRSTPSNSWHRWDWVCCLPCMSVLGYSTSMSIGQSGMEKKHNLTAEAILLNGCQSFEARRGRDLCV